MEVRNTIRGLVELAKTRLIGLCFSPLTHVVSLTLTCFMVQLASVIQFKLCLVYRTEFGMNLLHSF